MGEGDGATGGSTPPVSMDDLKNLETSLTSSMNTQMEELRAMMRQLLNGNKPPLHHRWRLMLPPRLMGRSNNALTNPLLKLMVGGGVQ